MSKTWALLYIKRGPGLHVITPLPIPLSRRSLRLLIHQTSAAARVHYNEGPSAAGRPAAAAESGVRPAPGRPAEGRV